MVKFNKHLESRKVQKWSQDYINYKSLKQIINEIYIKIRFNDAENLNTFDDGSNNSLFEGKPSFESHNPVLDDIHRPSSAYRKNPAIKKFLDSLDKETKKLYFSYAKIERDLFIKLNKLLHNKESYNTLSILSFLSECEKIYLLTLDTRLFADYAYINLEGIRKIIKKFDKKMSKFYRGKSIMLRYMKTRLADPNSDLNYILQLKIIDELILLIDLTSRTLITRLKEIVHESSSPEKKRELELQLVMNNNLDINQDFLNEIISKVNKYMKEIKSNLSQININGQYRAKYLNYGTFFGFENIDNLNRNNNNGYFSENEDEYGLIAKEKEETLFLIKEFVPQKAFEEMKANNRNMISEINLGNIYYVMNSRTFSQILYTTNYGFLLKTFIEIYRKDGCYLGLGISLIFLGQGFAKIIFEALLKKEKYFKISFVLSSIFILLSNILLIPWLSNQKINFFLLLFSRFVLGMGTSGKPEKTYLMTYTPKNSLYIFIKMYDSRIMIGRIIGLILGGFFIQDSLLFFLLIVSNFAHIVATFYYFKDPSQPYFSIMKKNINLHSLDLYNDNDIFDKEEKRRNEEEEINEEQEKLANETNEQLKDINSLNRFTDSNLIPNNVLKVINNHKNNQKSMLFNLTMILSLSQFINSSLQVLFPISLLTNGFGVSGVYLMAIPFLLYFLFTFTYSKIFSKRKFLRPLLVSQIFILFSMLFLFVFHVYLFCFFYMILIPFNLTIQRKIRRFVSMTFSNEIKFGKMNSNSFIGLSFFIVTIMGNLFPWFLNKTLGMPIDTIDGLKFIPFYFCYVAFCLILLAAFTLLYNRKIDFVKSKMLARIIKKKLY